MTTLTACFHAICARRANGAVQSGKLLLAEMEPRIELHGQLTTLTKVIEEEHFRTVESEVYRVLALINVEITVCTCTCPPPPLFGHSE